MATAPSPNDLTRQQLDELDALLQRMLTLPLTSPDGGAAAQAPPQPSATPGPSVPNWRIDPPTPAPIPAPHLHVQPPVEPTRPAAPEPTPVVLKNPFLVPVTTVEPPSARPQPTVSVTSPPPAPAIRQQPVAVVAVATVPIAPPVSTPLPAPVASIPAPVASAPAPITSTPLPAPVARSSVSTTPPIQPVAAPTEPVAATLPPPEPAAPVVTVRSSSRTAPIPKPAPWADEEVPPPAPVVATSPIVQPPIPLVLWPLVAFNKVVDAILGLLGPPGWLLRSGFGKNLLGLVGVGLLAYTTAHVAQQQGWVSLPFPLPWPQ